MDAQLDGAAADAVDPEHEVEEGAEHGQGPDDGDPDDGGAGVALVEQGMAGGQETADQVKSGRDVRPDERIQMPVHRREVSRKIHGAQVRA